MKYYAAVKCAQPFNDMENNHDIMLNEKDRNFKN